MQEKEQRIRYKYVDNREPEDIRAKLLEYGWVQQQLHCADFWFFDYAYKKIGIERKSVDDFIASIGDRLTNQLERCLDSYDSTILMLEGNWRKTGTANNIQTNRGVSYNTWAMAWNYIRTQQLKGITLEITIDVGHTIQRLNELYAWYQSPGHTGGMSHKTFIDDRIMAFPKGCRGKTAIEVLKVFKSLVAVGNAEVSDLRHVEGIGDGKARMIYDHFNSWRGDSGNEEKVQPEEEAQGVTLEEESEVKPEQGRMI